MWKDPGMCVGASAVKTKLIGLYHLPVHSQHLGNEYGHSRERNVCEELWEPEEKLTQSRREKGQRR